MTTVSIFAPNPNQTVHADFTVTGMSAEAQGTHINVLIQNDASGALAFQQGTANAQGNWSVTFHVNADDYQGNSTLRAWSAADGVDQGLMIIP